MPKGLKLTASNAVTDFQIEISAQTDIAALFEWVSHNGVAPERRLGELRLWL